MFALTPPAPPPMSPPPELPADGRRRLTAEVRGHVHGVGFRYFARSHARRLGLGGFVRNDPDGTVLVVAEGRPAALEELLGALRSGPDLAEVEEVVEEWGPARGRFRAFTVEL